MSLTIGANDIYYNCDLNKFEIPSFIKEDSEESVSQYQNWLQLQKREKEILNGMQFENKYINVGGLVRQCQPGKIYCGTRR